jgi:hypothetical protein
VWVIGLEAEGVGKELTLGLRVRIFWWKISGEDSWPCFGKALFLILGFLPASTNQMVEKFPVQYFYLIFTVSYLSTEVCRYLIPIKPANTPKARIFFEGILVYALLSMIIIYSSFGDPVIHKEFSTNLGPFLTTLHTHSQIFYNHIPAA